MPFTPLRIRWRKFGIFKRNNIQKLPVELLVEIFLCCLPTDRFPDPSRREAPILLGWVCRVWRSVSLNTPQLWAQITIRQRKRSYFTSTLAYITEKFDLRGILEWLRRSGNSPLSFEIDAHTGPHDGDVNLLTHALRSQAHRWKEVILRSNCKCIDHISEILWTPGLTPMLTDIRFLTNRPFKNYMPIPCASQLRSFYLRLTENLFFSDGRFHTLRELRIGRCRSCQLYPSIFAQFPLLEILEITSSPWSPPHGTVTVVHTLQHLHTFIFVDPSEYARLWLLDFFDTPALHSLAVSIWKVGGRFRERTHLSNFLMRCGGQLKRLQLEGYPVYRDDINGCIRHTPILESLCIDSMMLTGDLTTLCPTLVQVDILVTRLGLEGTLIIVDDFLSQWKNSSLKKPTSTTTIYIIRVPFYELSEVLNHQKMKKSPQHGFRIALEEESWWDKRVY
ncbi:hypothetical protein BD410DRAFT_789405 [Rickenella mellea]|uniref:Uncharacterized protein n=1 Tax=Rickenella mellea TaxID=50990 RepID=A0A4Y7Q2V4_9AGAM|nr:hypothetical protein BD410DRAFT_789405 [Rickenella mellea]